MLTFWRSVSSRSPAGRVSTTKGLLIEAVLADHLYDLRSHITCLQLPHSSCYHLVQAATLRALIDLIAAIMVMALPKAQNCYSALKDKTNPCMHCSAGWTNSHLDLPSLT